MPKITIYESVGGNSELVTNYGQLENHHPSKRLQESGRVYARVNGENEEILGNYRGTAVLTPGGEYMVSKDMVLTAPGLSNGNVPIPSPAAGVIGKIDRDDGVITINDPKTGDTMFQIRHAQIDPNLKAGDKIEYGQSLGKQHGYNNGNPDAFPDHVHFDVNTKYIAQADKWIKDMHAGTLTTDKRPAQTENLTNPAPTFVPISGNFPKPADPPLADGKLSFGEKGPEVEKLQRALIAAGAVDAEGKALNPDQDYGRRTREAVEDYQKKNGQPVTGVADQKMLTDLGVIAPAQQTPTQQTPAQQTPAQQTPVEQTPTQQTPTPQPAANKVSGGPNDYGSDNPLGNLIARGEGDYGSYNRGRAGDANGAKIDFSEMTVGELMRRQALPSGDPDRLFAVGKYQVIPSTMKGAVETLGIDKDAKFTPQLQERIFADYLMDEKRPDIKAYVTGKTSGPEGLERAQYATALEWASVGDPRKGGASHYGDVGNNAASITPDEVGRKLNDMRDQYQKNVQAGMNPDEAYRALSGDPKNFGQNTSQGQTTGQKGGLDDTLLVKEERGEGVRRLQEALNKAGIRDDQGQPLPTTGYFGDRTEAAVRKYQEQKGLEVDGKAGENTLKSLGIFPGQEQTQTPAQPKVETPTQPQPTQPEQSTPQPTQPRADTPAQPQPTQPQPNTPAQPNATIPANVAASEGILQQGSTGPDVAKLQTMLNNQGYRGPDGQPIPTNGTFDAATTHALKAFERDNGMDPNGIAGPKTLEALSKAEQSPKLSNPNHPDNALYQQAMKGLELMPAGTFKNAQERENAAATIAFEAKVSGLSQIDHVKSAGNNAGFFAVQGGLEDPSNRRVYVDREQAVQQTVQQSTQLMQQNTQNQPQAPAQDTTQQRETPSRPMMV
jgi:peptidoglycan hydrolase-like protein with peptidoglycan-binding domain